MKTTAQSNPKSYKFSPKKEWPGSLSLVGKAFTAVRENPDFMYLFIGILGVFTLLNYVVAPTPFFSFDLNSDSNPDKSSLTITFLAAFVSFVLSGPLTLYQLHLADGKRVSVSDIIRTGLSRLLDFIVMNLVLIACVLVGLILFIVPGILIALRLVVANYILFDKNVGPIEALKESFEMTKGKFGEVAGYVGVIVLLSLAAGILNIFIPVFGNMIANAVVVVYGVVGAWLYRWLSKQ